jgi:hypothetical protein
MFAFRTLFFGLLAAYLFSAPMVTAAADAAAARSFLQEFAPAYVVLGPWVGRLADAWHKPRVMQWANALKLMAVLSILLGLDVMLVKQISDSACESAGRSWSENVDHCAEQLGAWLGAEFSAS